MVFTGIVEGQASVSRIEEKDDFRSLVLKFPGGALDRAKVGASIAVNGTCLTIVSISEPTRELSFDVIGETLDKTNLGDLREGLLCNFERAARIGDEIGGHVVSGHVHTVAKVSEVERTANNVRYQIRVPGEYLKYVLPKGYVAVDGISLTVGEVVTTIGGPEQGEDFGYFNLYLIPETLRVTTLGAKREGDCVNLEIDAQTQTIVDTIMSLGERGTLKDLFGAS